MAIAGRDSGFNTRQNDVYSFFIPKINATNYKWYVWNNWNDFINLQNSGLIQIHNSGGAIWLNAKGDICYRLVPYGDIHTSTPEKASIVLSNFFKINISIKKKFIIDKSNTAIPDFSSIYQILINDLPLIENETLNFFQRFEFFSYDKRLIYRNTFNPSFYLTSIVPPDYGAHNSIILQYLYYLSNYNQERFEWILHWLAAFFQDFNLKSTIPLVLIGNQESGTDILFDEIIKPLFGEEYCIKIIDDYLRLGNFSSSLHNKLFYNFNNISKNASQEVKSNILLSNMIVKQKLLLAENKNTINETNIFGQILITIDTPYMPYLDNSYSNYTVFKVPNSLEKNMFFPEWSVAISTSPFNITTFIDAIRNDLFHFSHILKNVQTSIKLDKFYNDDKNLIEMNSEDKLTAFSNALVNMDTAYFAQIKSINEILYEDIMQDFKVKRIKQPNIFRCFECIHSDEKHLSPKKLMHKLKQIHNFFSKEAIHTGAGGVKYFHYD